MQILYALLAMLLGFLIEVYTHTLVRTFGHLDWAERYLGPGGSYTAWKIAGLLCIGFGIWSLTHTL